MFPGVKLRVSGKKISVLEPWDCPNRPDCCLVLGIREAVRDNELYYALLSLLREEACVCTMSWTHTHTHARCTRCSFLPGQAWLCRSELVFMLLMFRCVTPVWLCLLGDSPPASACSQGMSFRWCNRVKQCCFRRHLTATGERERQSDMWKSSQSFITALPLRRIRWCRDARRAQADDWLTIGWAHIKAWGVHRFHPPEAHRHWLWCVQRGLLPS